MGGQSSRPTHESCFITKSWTVNIEIEMVYQQIKPWMAISIVPVEQASCMMSSSSMIVTNMQLNCGTDYTHSPWLCGTLCGHWTMTFSESLQAQWIWYCTKKSQAPWNIGNARGKLLNCKFHSWLLQVFVAPLTNHLNTKHKVRYMISQSWNSKQKFKPVVQIQLLKYMYLFAWAIYSCVLWLHLYTYSISPISTHTWNYFWGCNQRKCMTWLNMNGHYSLNKNWCNLQREIVVYDD